MIKIYIDIYFFVNFCIDYISLYASCRISHKNPHTAKLCLASALGGAVSLFLLFQKTFLSCLVLLPTGYLMCLIVFPPPALFPFFIFLCSEIFVGGILTSIESVIRKSFSAALLPLPVIVLALTAEAVFTVLQRRTARSMQTICVEAKVKTGEKEATLTLMVDSGNFAFEQTSGKRIIFIGRKAANRLDFSSLGKFYPVSVRSATGKTVLNAYVPDKIKFDRENYAKEDFLLLPDPHCDDFCGFDGIIPIVR